MNAQAPTPQAASLPVLRWHETLQFKLAATLVVLFLLALAAAAIAGKFLVRDDLAGETFRYEQESGRRLALQMDQLARSAEDSARSIAALLPHASPDHLRSLVPALVADNPLYAAVGIWPEPNTLRPGVERASLLWMRGSDGRLQPREDYNDARVVPYWHERWYTPARELKDPRCSWSLSVRDPLSKAATLICSLPFDRDGRFSGVVTVALPVTRLLETFAARTGGEHGYSLLLDTDSNILAASPALAGKLPQDKLLNLAGLAQQFGAYNPLALALHQRNEELLAEFQKSPLAGAARKLKADTRELSAEEAQTTLLALWMGGKDRPLWESKPGFVLLDSDPVIGGRSYVSAFELGYPGWRLLRVTSASEGFAGVDILFLRTLLVTAGALALLLALLYFGFGVLVLGPLGRMVERMSETSGTNDSLGLLGNDRAANELGLFAHWHNERVRQLRDVTDRNISINSQLATETSERRKLQEQGTRQLERHSLALQALDEAVISTDENGRVEDMNPAAERLTGHALKTARGQAFADVCVTRHSGSESGGDTTADLARTAMERGTRIEQGDNLVIVPRGGPERPVLATATPIRTRSNRIAGAVVVLRERSAVTAAAAAAGLPATESVRVAGLKDPLTGLPLRGACEQRVRELVDAAKLAPRSHAMLWLDLDQFSRVSDSGSLAAGDAVLSRLAELLVNLTGSAGELFRIGADRFTIVLGNSSADRARTFAEALRRTVASTRFAWEARQYNLTLSIGITEFNGGSEGAQEVLRRAEEACGAAKRAGRNSIKVYDDSMSRHRAPSDDAIWARRIRNGLEQGLLHLTTQGLQAAQPRRGQMLELQLALEDEEGFWTPAPGFMPAAERQRLAGELDRWTVQRILGQLARQADMLGELSLLFIPLSGVSLIDPRFIDSVIELLGQSNAVTPDRICFMADQKALLAHPQSAAGFASTLRSMGCRLAIDGFSARGAGELALLRSLPAEFLRVDATLYPAAASDPAEQALAESTLRLARALERRLIVHNLDDPRLADLWRRVGADYLQGNALSRAVPLVFASS
ncbi:EAL domain-containing protein [Solimonas sp. K1W22B-7]|uniref:EAL domain-containing protein n=1 Tax=Solimonas sp. K1W22B-7 TaxID=2303331 RepID=UPI000E337168|nr:EAL domain-containing protein [Solimonas sp. K1W22B-7]AXQ29015.1 EAL domain-containing protein [Solimonas sp. K1W22B-7]